MATTTTRNPAVTMDPEKLQAFLGKVVADLGSTFGTALAIIGDRLGLYRALAESGPLTSEELAKRTGTVERYVREWLVNQAAGGYLEYDPATGRYTLPAEQALALADETGPFFAVGGFQVARAMLDATERIVEDFRAGKGMGWGEHHHDLFEGTYRFFRAGYLRDLVDHWIPALDGVREKLEAGGVVADVGCGWGASTLIMAQAFPRSRFHGYDLHAPSIERARGLARGSAAGERVAFDVAPANGFAPAPAPAAGYDLVAFFDCFHDLPDPSAAARRAYENLAPDGTVMIVEPMAGETVEENLNPVGRVFSGCSVLCCTPNALAGGKTVLGTIAPDSAIAAILREAGFTRIRRATETPFNRVFEARR
ncbi:MAG TPA: class I SAM-dependent methyltransferase [Longimicrobiales bacterium]